MTSIDDESSSTSSTSCWGGAGDRDDAPSSVEEADVGAI
jgi:hypothetical protein